VTNNHLDPNIVATCGFDDSEISKCMNPLGKQEDIVRVAGQCEFCFLPHVKSGRIIPSTGVKPGPIRRFNTGIDTLARVTGGDIKIEVRILEGVRKTLKNDAGVNLPNGHDRDREDQTSAAYSDGGGDDL
jgi:hypothetical protein